MITCASSPKPLQVIRRRGFQIHMETTTKKRHEHVHYDHTDACRLSRWSARESYRFMYYSRPWSSVLDFYSNLVANVKSSSLTSLFGRSKNCLDNYDYDSDKDQNFIIAHEEEEEEEEEEVLVPKKKSGRWARVTFKVVLAYDGPSFDGWQKQPDLNTVQGLVESSLVKFDDKEKPKGGVVVVVAGRTDKGVTALSQVCSFYTWRKDFQHKDIEEAINSAVPRKLTVKSVSRVSRSFHPNFSAKWRRYLYIFPLDSEEDNREINENEEDSDEELEIGDKPRTFSVERVDQLLRQLEGKLLSYKMFARDTKASRNEGPPTECFMYHARASEARLPRSDGLEGKRVMCVELVANRFLRKMVRVLVATAIREAAAGAEEDALIKLMGATCRRATAPPAPPDGLCLVDVGYTEFDPRVCLICED